MSNHLLILNFEHVIGTFKRDRKGGVDFSAYLKQGTLKTL